jgi:hypothetical protein
MVMNATRPPVPGPGWSGSAHGLPRRPGLVRRALRLGLRDRSRLRHAVIRRLSRRFGPRLGALTDLEVRNVPIPGEVAVYYGDDGERSYQLVQWLPVLEQLHAVHPVTLVLRRPSALRALRGRTALPMVCARRFDDLMSLYTDEDYKVVLYVNNGVTNFQSLAAATLLHVHINHGESDKSCMVSNQVKAYDRVFVAGGEAIRRHRDILLDFDERRLVPVGRPQLDLAPAPQLAPSRVRTILYAPTWEGATQSNNYTSVDVYGPEIVRALLAVPDARVVYKPHPRVPTSQEAEIVEGHGRILRLVEEARAADPGAGHRTILEGDVLAMVDACDLMVTDVSSVGLDFLYLRTEKPIFITDRWNERDQLLRTVPVARCADVIDRSTLSDLTRVVGERLDHDLRWPERQQMRSVYFGDLTPGESTKRFISAVEEAITLRDRQLTDRESTRNPGPS